MKIRAFPIDMILKLQQYMESFQLALTSHLSTGVDMCVKMLPGMFTPEALLEQA